MQIKNGLISTPPTQRDFADKAMLWKLEGHLRRPPRQHLSKYDGTTLRELRKVKR